MPICSSQRSPDAVAVSEATAFLDALILSTQNIKSFLKGSVNTKLWTPVTGQGHLRGHCLNKDLFNFCSHLSLKLFSGGESPHLT